MEPLTPPPPSQGPVIDLIIAGEKNKIKISQNMNTLNNLMKIKMYKISGWLENISSAFHYRDKVCINKE